MAINGLRNRFLGPGGGTRRLHHQARAFEGVAGLVVGAK